MKNLSKKGMTIDEGLAFFSPERRKEFLDEAGRAVVQKMLSNGSSGATLGQLLDRLRLDPHWNTIKEASAEAVFGSVKTTKTKTKTTKTKRPRQTLTDEVLASVLAVIKKNPGIRAELVCDEHGKIDRATCKKALHKLRAQGKVKTKGVKRKTTYTVAGK